MARRTLKLSRSTVAEPLVATPEPEPTVAAMPEPVGEIEYTEPDSSDFVSPESAESAPDPGEQPRKRGRGRPAGSTSKAKRDAGAADKETPENLGDLLYSVHFMLAKLCNSDLLELDEDEAKKMGTAIARVQKHTTNKVLSPKQLAWLNLLTVTGSIYGPRVVAMANNSRAKKNKGKVTIISPTPETPQPKQATTIDAQ